MSLETGQVIDRKYRIIRLLGEGGMGAVYEGENTLIQRRVAIKVLHAAAAANADVVMRFEREAQAAGRIGNDHILEVLDLGTLDGGDRYMVLEFLDGEPLSARIERLGRLTPAELAPLTHQALIGLKAAHDAGIIHRDLKPDNIYVLKSKAGHKDFVKIIDFGISKFAPLGGEMRMTQTGAVMGTPYYMSPEQAKGASSTDCRSDLYAIGVIMYEAVTGQVPFDAQTFNELLFKIVLAEPTPVKALVPDLDDAFASIVTKAMARDPQHRFQNAQDFMDALDAWSSKGSAVSIPPATTEQERITHATPGGSAEGRETGKGKATSTGGNWGATVGEPPAAIPVKAKPNTTVIALAALGVLLVLGGIAALAMGGSQEEANAAASASAAVAAAPPPPATPAVLPEPPKVKAEGQAPAAEAPKEAPAASATAATAAAEPAPAAPVASQAPTSQVTRRSSGTSTTPKASPKAASSKGAGPTAPAPKPAGGGLDFGY